MKLCFTSSMEIARTFTSSASASWSWLLRDVTALLATADRRSIAADFFNALGRPPEQCRGLVAYTRRFVHADPVFALYVDLSSPDLDWGAAKATSEQCYGHWAWDMMTFRTETLAPLALCSPFLYYRDAKDWEDCDVADIYRFFLFAIARLRTRPVYDVSHPVYVDWADYRAWHELWARQAVESSPQAISARVAFCITGAVRHLGNPLVYEGIRKHVVESANSSVRSIFYVLNVAREPKTPHKDFSAAASRNLPSAEWITRARRLFWSPGEGSIEAQQEAILAKFPGEPAPPLPGDQWPTALAAVFAAMPPTSVFIEPAEQAPELQAHMACNGSVPRKWPPACNRQFAGLELCYEQVQQYERHSGQTFDFIYRIRTDLLFFADVGDIRVFGEGIHVDMATFKTGVNDEFAIIPRRYAEDYFSTRSYAPCLPQQTWDNGLCDTDGCQCRLRYHLNARGAPLRLLRRQYLRPSSWD